jgi:hypothetical protein
MLTFYRHNYTELVITLRADSSLGLLDGDYIEDYFGTDGQLTLYNVEANTRTPILIEEDVEETPSVLHDVFVAVIDLSTVVDGLYRIEGRIRDTAGNYSILSEVQTPLGFEDVTPYEILISPLTIVVYSPKVINLYLQKKPVMQVQLQKGITSSLALKSSPYSAMLLQHKPAMSLKLEGNDFSTKVLLEQKPMMQLLSAYTL